MKNKNVIGISPMTLVIATVLIFTGIGTAMATVWTDQADYSPGSIVTISGNNSDNVGYLSEETVNVSVNRPGGYDSSCNGIVDTNGAWSCQVTLSSDDTAIGQYTYTAVGQTSGKTQSGTFTDAKPTRIQASSMSPSSGACGSTVTVKATLEYKYANPSDWRPLPGKTVSFILGSSSSSGTTDTNGVATVTLIVPSGATSLAASFAGDVTYNSITQNIAFIVTGSCGVPPSITTQPISITDTVGDSATFSVTATGTSPLTYQWRKGGSNIVGATSSIYTISSVVISDGGSYDVVVTNAYGSAISTVASLTVNKATPTILITPYSVTYDGSAHTATGTAKGVNNEDLTGLVLTGTTHTDAGDYLNDQWTFTDVTGNYKDASGTVHDSIARADATISVVGYSVTYDGNLHTATGTATGVKGESLNGLDLSGTMHTNAGDYPSDSWSFTDSTGNYNNANDNIHDAISKATATITVIPYSVTYDGDPHTATGSATGVKGESLSGFDLTGTIHTDAGTYSTDAWTFTDVNGNYKDASGAISDSIAKADATISVNGYTGIYDGNSHGASGAAKGVGGTDLSNSLNLGSAFTNVPGGTAHWTFIGGTNYNDASGDVNIAISKADATISVTGYSVTYDGSSHIASGSTTGVKGENLNGLDLSGTEHTNAGDYSSDAWSFTDSTGNYKDVSGTVSDSIAKANPSITVTPYSVIYDGNAHTATGSATGVKGESLNGLDLSGTTHTNTGDYTDTWKFTDVTGNYKDDSSTVSDSIGKADASISVTGYSVTYDGDVHTATGSATGVKGESLNGLDLSGTVHTNAGDYPSDTWKFTDTTGNYKDQSGTVHDSIAKATPTINWANPADIIYGTALSNIQLNAVASVQGSYVYTPPVGTILGAGSGQILHVDFTPTDTTNYNVVSKDVTINVLYQSGGTCYGNAGHQILQPINPDSSSVFKYGSTVPAKFRVCDAGGNSVGTPGVVSDFKLLSTTYGAGSIDENVVSTTPDTAFRWDSTSQQWIFNMNTKNLKAGYKYTYRISLNDGSNIDFIFGLK